MWKSIPPASPQSLKSYVAMIAGQIALDRYAERKTLKRGGGQLPLVLDELQECIPDTENDADPIDSIVLRDALNRFLRALPEKTRNIFVRRYWYCASVSEIAEEFSMKVSSITVLMLRTRKKLKIFLEKEGFTV